MKREAIALIWPRWQWGEGLTPRSRLLAVSPSDLSRPEGWLRGWMSWNAAILVLFKFFLPRTATTLKQASVNNLSNPPSPYFSPSGSFLFRPLDKICFFFYSCLIIPIHVWPLLPSDKEPVPLQQHDVDKWRIKKWPELFICLTARKNCVYYLFDVCSNALQKYTSYQVVFFWKQVVSNKCQLALRFFLGEYQKGIQKNGTYIKLVCSGNIGIRHFRT